MANEKLINSRVQLKIDSDYNWAKATTFIPKDGEPIIYRTDNDIVRIKIGDGSTVVNDLPFINTPYQVLPADPNRQLYSIVDEILHHCFNQHALLADKEKLYLIYFESVSETNPDPFLHCTCLTNGGRVSVLWTEEVAEEFWRDFSYQVWLAGFESLCDEWASKINNPMVLCRPYNGGENGYVNHIQETTVQYHTITGDFPKVTTSNNQSITAGNAFLSHYDTGLSEQVTITDLLNVYSLYYADTCSGMRLGTSKNVGSITISCPYEFEVRYASYFSYNSSTGAIVGQDDSWISIDGNKMYLGVGATASSTFSGGGTHTISTCVDENGAHQGRIIITGFTVMSSDGPSAEYTYHELARLEDITAEIDNFAENVIAPMQQAVDNNYVSNTKQDKAIKELQDTLGTTQIYDVNYALPKASAEQINGKIYQFKDNLYKCIPCGEGENQEYSLALAGTSEITVEQLTQENSPVYGELGKTFKQNIEIATTITKTYRNGNSIKLGSSSGTGEITFMNLHKLPIAQITVGLQSYNAKGSSFEFEDDQSNRWLYDIDANDTAEKLYTIKEVAPGSLTNLTIRSCDLKSDGEAAGDKRGCITRLIIDYGNVTYTWKQLTGTTAQLVTWKELKALRDSSSLIPGQKYCITDYQCTTTQEFTSAENNNFYITVEALSENTLSENATASINPTLYQPYFKDSVMATEQVTSRVTVSYVMHTDGEFEADYWNPMKDIFVHYAYAPNNDGDTVPVIYKTERAGVDFTLPDYDPEEFGEPDWQDTYYYISDYTHNNTKYNLWRKIDNDEYSWDSAETYHILTNTIVLDGQFNSYSVGSSDAEGTLLQTVKLNEPQIIPTYVKLLSYEMIDWAYESITYLSDDARFIYSASYEENLDGQIVPVLYNWAEDDAEERPEDYVDKYYFVGVETMNDQKCSKWRKIEGGSSNLGWNDTSKIYVYTNDIVEYRSYFSDNDLSLWELKYCLDNDTSRFAWADNGDSICITNLQTPYSNGEVLVRKPEFDKYRDMDDYPYAWATDADLEHEDDTFVIYSANEIIIDGEEVYNQDTGAMEIARVSGVGKGVIYYMKDEFNNECPYDFKNIKFDCSAEWQNAALSLESSSALPALYTFEYTMSGETLMDPMKYIGDGSINGHAKQNIIKPAYDDQQCQILNHIVLYQSASSPVMSGGVVSTSYIYNNRFDLNNTNIIMTNNSTHGALSDNICGPNIHNCLLYCQKGNNLLMGNNKYIIIPAARPYPYWFDWYVCGQPGQEINMPGNESEVPVKFVTACTEYII